MKIWITIMIVVFFLGALPMAEIKDFPEVPIVRKTFSADHVEIVYTIQGRGKTALIFIHGGFADRSFWANQINPFSKKYRVIALDLAGHGESGINRKKWNVFTLAEDVRAVMEAEKVAEAVLVGNSLGGPVALETARLLPDKVLGIVVVDTLHDLTVKAPESHYQNQARAFDRDFKGTMNQMVRALFHTDVDPDLFADVQKKMLKSFTGMVAPLMESFAAYDLVKTVKNVSQPIRCINGDLYPTNLKKNRTIHANFDAVVLPHTGHYPMLERPQLFNRHLEKFLLQLIKEK